MEKTLKRCWRSDMPVNPSALVFLVGHVFKHSNLRHFVTLQTQHCCLGGEKTGVKSYVSACLHQALCEVLLCSVIILWCWSGCDVMTTRMHGRRPGHGLMLLACCLHPREGLHRSLQRWWSQLKTNNMPNENKTHCESKAVNKQKNDSKPHFPGVPHVTFCRPHLLSHTTTTTTLASGIQGPPHLRCCHWLMLNPAECMCITPTWLTD